MLNFVSSKFLKIYTVISLCAIGIFFSFYKLIEAPAFWFDEGYFTQAAMNIAVHGVWGIQTAPGQFSSLLSLSAGFPLLGPLALVFKIFGVGVLQARMLMAVFLICLIGVSFVFIKRLFGFYYGAAAALLIGTFPVLYGNGKVVLGEVPGLFFYALFLLFVTRWMQSNKKIDGLYAGLFLGIVITAKISFLLVCIPATILTIFLQWKSIRSHKMDLIIVAGAATIPFVVWIATQFNQSDTLVIFLRTIFYHYSDEPAQNLFVKNVLRFFTESSPISLLIIFGIWITSVTVRLRKKIPLHFAEMHAMFFSVFTIGIFLLSPGWYRYFFPAQIIAYWFFPRALVDVVGLTCGRLKFLSNITTKICVVFILLIALAQSYETRFHSYVASYYHSNKTRDMQEGFSKLDTNAAYLIYDVPEALIFLPQITYHQYINGNTQFIIGQESLAEIYSGKVDKIIIGQQNYLDHQSDFLNYKTENVIAGKYVVLVKNLKK